VGFISKAGLSAEKLKKVTGMNAAGLLKIDYNSRTRRRS